MKQLIIGLVLVMIGSGTLFSQEADYHTVPLPGRIDLTKEEPFNLNENTRIIFPSNDECMQRNALFLSSYLSDIFGYKLEVSDAKNKKEKCIVLCYDNLAPESYKVTVSESSVKIAGGDAAGVFYGIQMLRKSISSGSTNALLPSGVISAEPQYSYRGMHLDCARHFFSVDIVKQYLDMLALHHINTFHWHLTDDQGWRLEIKKYPRLTEIGSYRSSTVVGMNTGLFDDLPHGGFYTQDEVREIVRYAQERYITVIPEIDMPGHMLSALAAYPEFGCSGGPYEVSRVWGINSNILCVGNDDVYPFLQDILDEVFDLFPSTYVHIGGDEAPRTKWESCEHCQQKIKELGLTSEDGVSAESKLQAYFTSRMNEYILSKGHKTICWDESLEDLDDSSVTIMSWHGADAAAEAFSRGMDVIYTPMDNCYFNYYQSKLTPVEPQTLPLFVTVEDTYSMEVPEGVKGVQGNMWSEYISSRDVLEYQLLPHLSALSEVQWTPKGQKDFEQFKTRMKTLTPIFESYGWDYAKHIFTGDTKPNFYL